MSAAWVAAQVRSRSLTNHCVGPAGAREVAGSGSLDGALAILATTNYGERLGPGAGLAQAERAVFATALWNLRVLAGWSPALGAGRLRVLAGGFELANVRDELARIDGHDVLQPYELGSLASVPRHSQPTSTSELRATLRHSAWGDPGVLDAGGILLSLRVALLRRVVENVPEAAEWAEAYGALILARLILCGTSLERFATVAADARAVLGSRAVAARTLRELVTALPVSIAHGLDGVTEFADLWSCEARWWGQLWREASERVRDGGAEAATVVAAVAAQYADAWRVRAALEIAARAGLGIEVLDAVA